MNLEEKYLIKEEQDLIELYEGYISKTMMKRSMKFLAPVFRNMIYDIVERLSEELIYAATDDPSENKKIRFLQKRLENNSEEIISIINNITRSI